MVQGAKSGGGVSAPIAQKIMEECFALEKGYDPGLVKLEPAVGSFAQIEAIDFKKKDVPAAITSQFQEDRETADHVADPLKTKQERQVGVAPDIRAEADARGKARGGAPVAKPADKRNFFQRLFGAKPSAPKPQPNRPSGPPKR
jgi:penicillin-binding protein 2